MTTDAERRRHWDTVYATKAPDAVSWFEETPRISLDLIAATGLAKDAALLDVGGGVSRLADHLVAAGYTDLTVLDLSAEAIARLLARLGPAAPVRGVVADVTRWRPERLYDLWHDRAVLHFLVEEAGRAAYLETLRAALRPGGHLIVATFAPSGPERCSGLPVRRYGAADLDAFLGDGFRRQDAFETDHRTPSGGVQRFQVARYRRAG
jgi:SAM-dependent methyltransferase